MLFMKTVKGGLGSENACTLQVACKKKGAFKTGSLS